jgi:hypothetical protein
MNEILSMKKVIASVGLVALGASGLQAVSDPGTTSDTSKPWSVSATLRGFYDDNVNSIANDYVLPAGTHRGSSGFEVSPSIIASWPLEQTIITLGYVYSFKYYENTPWGNAENFDQSHDFNASLTHYFSERYQINVKDSFVIGQEPDLLRAGNTYNTFQRIPGNNLRNYGTINFEAQITPKLGIEVGYANTLWSYANDTPTFVNGAYNASLTGLADSLDNAIHLDARWQLQPQTIGVLGYEFRAIDYTGNQPIAGTIDASGNALVPGTMVMSDYRNANSHYGYLGVDHNFTPDLTGSVRGGVRATTYPNDSSEDSVSPYGLLSLRYTYRPESYLQAGFSYDYSSAGLIGANDRIGFVTLNGQSASVFATLQHRLTPKLYGNLVAQFQNTTYYGGTDNGDSEQYYLVGLSLEYRFNHYFSAQVGYDYDNVNSDIAGRHYDRNRVYLGVTATY